MTDNKNFSVSKESAQRVLGIPALGDQIPEQIPEDTPENDQGKDSRASNPKPTVFDLYDTFMQNTYCANINGSLHIFDQSKGYYAPVKQREIEELLLDRFFDTVVASGSSAIVKKCADLIIKKRPAEVASADRHGVLCLQQGCLPLNDLEHTMFYPYSNVTHTYPTYIINAAGHPNLHNWGLMKTLATPVMDSFLTTVACNNPSVVTRIWQMIGYLLTPDVNGKCLFLLQGVPNSGKSVIGNLISALISAHRISNLDIDQLGKKNATSLLVDKSINISMDLPNKTLLPLAIRNIKLITGNDALTVEYGNGTYGTYYGGCKFLFATNHPLTLKGVDLGLEERIVCIPFLYTIPPILRDRNLLTNLLRERDNIVAKALAHYRDLRNNNYVFAGSDLECCKTNIRYLPTEAEDADATLCQFVEERCEFVSQEYGAYTDELYTAYCSFCKEHGETPIDNVAGFSRRLLRCYGDKIAKKKWRRGTQENRWGFRGIAIQAIIPVPTHVYYNV